MHFQIVKEHDTQSLIDLYVNPGAKYTKQAEGTQARLNFLTVADLYKEALTAFQNGQLSSFDPLVGDTVCQIRAAIVVDLFNQGGFVDFCRETSEKMNELSQKILGLQVPKNIPSFAEFLREQTHEEALPNQIHFLALGYFLTLTKVSLDFFEKGPNGTIQCSCLENLEAQTPLLENTTKSFRSNLIDSARKAFEELSLAYIRSGAASLNEPHKSRLETMVEEHNIIRKKGKAQAIPFFALTDILLYQALLKGTFIVLKVTRYDPSVISAHLEQSGLNQIDMNAVPKLDTLRVLYQPNPTRSTFTPVDVGQVALTSPCLVFEGLSLAKSPPSKEDYLADLMQFDLLDIIQANSASHSQYTGRENVGLDPLVETAEEKALRESFKKMGLEKGFSKEDQRRFRVQHVFPDLIGHQMKSALP